MLDFYVKVMIYLFSFVMCFFGLSALDFNRFIKQGKMIQGQVLYYVISCALAYLVANFIMGLIYRFN